MVERLLLKRNADYKVFLCNLIKIILSMHRVCNFVRRASPPMK